MPMLFSPRDREADRSPAARGTLIIQPFRFDPAGLPRGYVRFVALSTAAGALLFAGIAVYGFLALNRALSIRAQDVLAELILIKAAFLFVIAGVSAAMAIILGFISLRCWRSL